MRITVLDSLADIDPKVWDAMAGGDPFLKHGFLHGLEVTGCLAPQGWYPQHLAVYDDEVLRGVLPLYVRDNSYGEFVFDWSWADAFERAGGNYYPKLVTAIPFSPVTGRRLLIDPNAEDRAQIAELMVGAGVRACDDNGMSSWHCLFPEPDELASFEKAGLLTRLGCQYHWFNHDYADFDDFLAALTSKKRKQIKRERRKVCEQDLEIEVLVGDDISADHWSIFHRFYCSTFYRKWGEPRLTELFFQTLNERLPGAPMLLLASADGEYFAGAFALVGEDTLYGRHWGCSASRDNLHFELCYYRTIEYCIRHGLKRLDAGAQGEHKLARGFIPVSTWSMHWIRDTGFRHAVGEFVKRERQALEQQMRALEAHVAFKQN
ncbi:MAG: GNAT family N-acetyltransferase [Gammaproteobacteria bacterium]|nr:GNAT family N-acetyltransferase [Gammaproteobacteria bacterium]